MSFYLAIDAGGTKTHCWVADEARVLARVHGPTVKIMAAGEDTATERLGDLVQRALHEAALKPEHITRTAMGLAGSSSESVRYWARRTITSLVPGGFVLCGDEEIALDAAFHGGPGIMIIAGTGSNAVGRCAQGTLTRAGGWGPVLGDEGSGQWIGLEAIRSALRAHDRGADTCLLREIQEFWRLNDLGELVAAANQRSRPNFSELAGTVARCAENGDGLAQGVLERAGEELAAIVSLVASKMAAKGCDASESEHVAFTGSVLGRIAAVRRSFTARLAIALPNAHVAQDPVEPLEGALWRARKG